MTTSLTNQVICKKHLIFLLKMTALDALSNEESLLEESNYSEAIH